MAKLKGTTYKELDKLLGDKYKVGIGNNTTAERVDKYSIHIKLHGHHIVTLFSEGTMRFTLAGWPTSTTRDRVNKFLPMGYGVNQDKRVQYYYSTNGRRELDSYEWIEVS